MVLQLPDIPICEYPRPAITEDGYTGISSLGTFLIETTNVISPVSWRPTHHAGGPTGNGVMSCVKEANTKNGSPSCDPLCNNPSRDNSTQCGSRLATEGFQCQSDEYPMSANLPRSDSVTGLNVAETSDLAHRHIRLPYCNAAEQNFAEFERETASLQNRHVPSTAKEPKGGAGTARQTEALFSRSIGIEKKSVTTESGCIYGGIASIGDLRSGSSISFRSSPEGSSLPSKTPQNLPLLEDAHIDTVVTKTTVEERLKFVDVDFVQEVEKLVEVPKVFYNDVIVEVPQVVNVLKFVPKPEIRERIKYVPKYEVKTINKYVEVPIIKVVDRYEEILQVQEVLKPVKKNIVIERPVPVMKKVPKVIKKQTIREVPTPVYEEVNVPVYKYKMQPKILQAEIVTHTPHYIDVPVPYEQPVVKYEDLRVYSTQRCEMPFSKPLRYETWPPFKRGTYTKAAHAPIHVNSSVRKGIYREECGPQLNRPSPKTVVYEGHQSLVPNATHHQEPCRS